MDNLKIKELYDNLSLVMQEGDEEKAKRFLIDNFKSFPEENQKEITAAFVVEAIENEADRINAVTEMQKQGLSTIANLEKIKSNLEGKLKALDIEEQLKN